MKSLSLRADSVLFYHNLKHIVCRIPPKCISAEEFAKKANFMEKNLIFCQNCEKFNKAVVVCW